MYKPKQSRWGYNAQFTGQSGYQENYQGKQLDPMDRAKLAQVPIPLKHVGADPNLFKSSNQDVQEHTSPGKRADIHRPFQGTAGAHVPLGSETTAHHDYVNNGDSPRGLRHNPDFTKPSNMHLVKPDAGQYKSSNQDVQEHTSPGKRADIHRPFQGTAGAHVPLGGESLYQEDYVRLPPISPRALRHTSVFAHEPVPLPSPPRTNMETVYQSANKSMIEAKPAGGKAPYFE